MHLYLTECFICLEIKICDCDEDYPVCVDCKIRRDD